MMLLSPYNQRTLPITDSSKMYQEPNPTRQFVGGVVAAATIPKASKIIYKPLNKLAAKTFLNLAHKDGMNEAYNKILDNLVVKSGLDKKGIEIVDINPGNMEQVKKNLSKLFSSNRAKQKIAQTIKIYAEGNNACYVIGKNKILLNRQKMAIAAAHELGHAYNKDCSKLGKYLHKLKKIKSLPKSVAFIAALPIIFGTKKEKGEKTEGFIDKTNNFIRNNAGKIAAAGFLPEVLEEGLASYNAAKFSKGLLSKKHYMHMNKTNLVALTTYLTAMVGVGAAMNVGRYLKDTIAKPKEITV